MKPSSCRRACAQLKRQGNVSLRRPVAQVYVEQPPFSWIDLLKNGTPGDGRTEEGNKVGTDFEATDALDLDTLDWVWRKRPALRPMARFPASS